MNYKDKGNEIINHLNEWLESKQAKVAFKNRKEISNHVGISNSHFNKIVRGDAIPRDDTLRKIAILTEFEKNHNTTNKINQKVVKKQLTFTEEFRKWYYQKQNKFHTQRELGNYLGIDNSTINKYLKGKSIPKGDIALKLFEITGIESLSLKKVPKKDKKIKSKDVKSMESNIQEILQATKTIEQGMSIIQHAINENKSLKLPYKDKQLHKRFAIAFYQFADEIKIFKKSGIQDREKLREVISPKDVGYVSSFLKALFDEDKFSDFILFSDYEFESMGEENE